MVKKLVAIAVAGCAALALGVSGARAGSKVAFLCYSKYEVDPGTWSLTSGGRNAVTAAELMGLGYWAPYAEKTVPTHTELNNGWYLDCNLPSSLQPVIGETVTQKGDQMATNPWFLDHPGYYPFGQ